VDGKLIRKQKMREACEHGDRYRCPSDLDELVAEKISGVRQASKCPHSSDSFESLRRGSLFALRAAHKESVHPRRLQNILGTLHQAQGREVRAFVISPVAIVSCLLEEVANMHSLNTDTVGKVRSIISGIFTYAMAKVISRPARKAIIQLRVP